MGNFVIAKIVVEYDIKIFKKKFWLQMYNHLNPIRIATKPMTTEKKSNSFLGKLCQLMM